MKTFKNTSKPIRPLYPKYYGYDKPSEYLFFWSRLFQSVISQGGTYLLTNKYHSKECGIYKCEGGCRIDDVNDLVLNSQSCYFDYGRNNDEKEVELSNFITYIVLNWDPMDPINSMLKSAVKYVNSKKTSNLHTSVEDLKSSIEKSTNGGVFGGNCLSSFFNWNPFSEVPTNEDYERFCYKNYNNMTDKDITFKFKIRSHSKKLLEEINKKIKSNPKNQQYVSAMCCSPDIRENGEVFYWINTGYSTQIDYWQTEESIQEFLNSDGFLKKS